jgi:hypothetical protein
MRRHAPLPPQPCGSGRAEMDTIGTGTVSLAGFVIDLEQRE